MLEAYASEDRTALMIAKIFRNGRNQTVCIPVELSLDAETVTIERQGDALILRPLPSGGWDRFFADPSLVLRRALRVETIYLRVAKEKSSRLSLQGGDAYGRDEAGR
jgi:virulence-associated protein VagC